MTKTEASILLKTLLMDMIEYPTDIIHGNKYADALAIAIDSLREG